MYIGVISMRYAKALLAYADEKGTEDTVYEEAGILADSFSRIPELRQALDNPCLLYTSPSPRDAVGDI